MTELSSRNEQTAV